MKMIASKDPAGLVQENKNYTVSPQEEKDLKAIDFSSGLALNGNLSKFDPSNGNYIPPEGLKVDVKKGLVLDDQKFAQLKRSEQIVISKLLENKEEKNKSKKLFKEKVYPRKYELRVQYTAFASNMEFYNQSRKEKYHTQIHHLMKFSLMPFKRTAINYFQIDLSKTNVNFSKDSHFNVSQSAHDLFSIVTSFVIPFDPKIYNISYRIYFGFNFEQRFWPVMDYSGSNLLMKRYSRLGLHLMGHMQYSYNKTFGMLGRLKLGARFNPPNDQQFQDNKFINIELGPSFLLDKNLKLYTIYNGILEISSENNKKVSQSQHGFGLELQVDF